MTKPPATTAEGRYVLGDDPKARRLTPTWYRGPHCNFTPSATNLAEEQAIEKYLLHGWLPPKPVIPNDGRILAVGSCFAQHIVGYLRRSRGKTTINEGANVNLFAFGAGFVNTFTLRQQFEWALGKREIETATLFAEDPERHIHQGRHKLIQLPADAASREASREAICNADAFIVTLGLAEVWYEKESGDVFFGAVPHEQFDPERHAFRVSSVEENRDNLLAMHQLLRETRPQAPIVFTLSPVRATATFRPVSCLSANSVNKATLRVAVDELVRQVDDDLLFYWPGFEIVTDFYGKDAYETDLRHVKQSVVDEIMGLFEKHFIEPRAPRSPRRRALARRKV